MKNVPKFQLLPLDEAYIYIYAIERYNAAKKEYQ